MSDSSCDRLLFNRSLHCSLCRRRLPDFRRSDGKLESPEWEYRTLGFCNLGDSVTQPHIITIPVNLIDDDSLSRPCKFKTGRSVIIEFCPIHDCSECKEQNMAYFVHILCWKLTKSFPQQIIYQFAKDTYPMLGNEDIFISEAVMPIDFANIVEMCVVGDVHNDLVSNANYISLPRILKLFSDLPVELRHIITANCHSTLFSSLLTTSETSYKLLRSIKFTPDFSFSRLVCQNVVENLSATFVVIFGKRYISSLRFNGDNGIRIKTTKLKGIKFAMGPHGLQGLCILYTDGSISPWLGQEQDGWVGVLHGKRIRNLGVVKDSIKCRLINFLGEKATFTHLRVMWDKDISFTDTESHRLFEMSKSPCDPLFPGWRLCRYLPFCDGNYISGLTMYCNGHGITGIVVYGKSRQMIGSCSQCPIHLSLQPKERVISVWIRVSVGFYLEYEPNILVMTNCSRSIVFGPYLEPSFADQNGYEWICLTESSGSDIIGIFYDVLSLSGSNRITNIGITRRKRQILNTETIERPKIPFANSRPSFYHWNTDAYFTVGSLHNIRKLQTRRLGPRLTGMLISHYDNSVDILGQWDYSQDSSISTIYDDEDGIFMGITFVYSGSTPESYIKGIFVGIDSKEPRKSAMHSKPERTISFDAKIGLNIAWWFSFTCDEIQNWERLYRTLSISTHEHKITELI